MLSNWFSVALPHQWLSDFWWRDHWLYIIIYVCTHTIGTSGRHKIRKYKKLHFIFSWTWSLIWIVWATCVFAVTKHYFSTTSSGHLWSLQVALCECTLRAVIVYRGTQVRVVTWYRGKVIRRRGVLDQNAIHNKLRHWPNMWQFHCCNIRQCTHTCN